MGDNIVWGTSADDDVTWGSSPDAPPVDPSAVDQATGPAPSVDVEFGDPVPLVPPDPTSTLPTTVTTGTTGLIGGGL